MKNENSTDCVSIVGMPACLDMLKDAGTRIRSNKRSFSQFVYLDRYDSKSTGGDNAPLFLWKCLMS